MLRPHCTAERYRSIDGSCNNLNNAHYGAVESPLTRLLPPLYADGIQEKIISSSFYFFLFTFILNAQG